MPPLKTAEFRPLNSSVKEFLKLMYEAERYFKRRLTFHDVDAAVMSMCVDQQYVRDMLSLLENSGDIDKSSTGLYTVLQVPMSDAGPATLDVRPGQVRLSRPYSFCTVCGETEEAGAVRKLRLRLIRINGAVHHDACDHCQRLLSKQNGIEFVSVGANGSRAYYTHIVMNEQEVIDELEEWAADLDNEEFSANDERLEWLKTAIPYILAKMKVPSQDE